MRSKGNGEPKICAVNLLRITRGEIAYVRLRGMDGTLFALPDAADAAAADIEWVLETYEPRLNVNDVNTSAFDWGDYVLNVDLASKKGDDAV